MLKRSRTSARAAAVTEALRAAGCPAPRYVRVEPDRSLQEELPGEPLEQWRRAAVGALLSRRSYLRLGALRGHSDGSRELLERCREAARRHGDAVPEAGEIVHWDLTPDNVLVRDGGVSGVVDWEGTRVGDARFDLVTLAFSAPGTPLLEAAVAERVDPRVRAVYLAHLCVRRVEWSLLRDDAETARRTLAAALEVARGLPTGP